MELKDVIVEPGSNIVNGVSIIDRSSMMTYSKIVCCLCSAVIDANPSETFETCLKKSLNIKTCIPTEFELVYCKECHRFLRPPYVKIERESADMMKLCLSRIKSYDKKVKIIDSNFIYTVFYLFAPSTEKLILLWGRRNLKIFSKYKNFF